MFHNNKNFMLLYNKNWNNGKQKMWKFESKFYESKVYESEQKIDKNNKSVLFEIKFNLPNVYVIKEPISRAMRAKETKQNVFIFNGLF